MTISTKGRYGLRLMIDLAVHADEAPVSLRDVAARQEISEKYLEQIVLKLSRAELVRGMRGARGGYMLTRDPAAITAGEILRVVEGGLGPVACLDGSCERVNGCATFHLWKEIRSAVEGVVDACTLQELARRHREMI